MQPLVPCWHARYDHTHPGTKGLLEMYKLERLHLSSLLQTVGRFAFGECYLLLVLVFPPALETIQFQACVDCESLITVRFDTDTRTSLHTIADCSSLTEVTLDPSFISTVQDAFVHAGKVMF